MESTPEFVSYKKVLLFGKEGVGKTSLIKRIEKNTFSKDSIKDDRK